MPTVVTHSVDRIVLVSGIDEAGLGRLQVTPIKITTCYQTAPLLLVFGNHFFFFCSREKKFYGIVMERKKGKFQ
jgi:hypothetical protein